jgi:hypothetical protein
LAEIGKILGGKLPSVVGGIADVINHPTHYTFGKIEVIDVIEDWKLPFHIASVVKYVARAPHKGNELDDLRKAAWFLNRYIQLKERGQ